MAQQDNTGGDGTTGMTGLEVRQAYDNNFDELYGNMKTHELAKTLALDLVFDKNEISYQTRIMSSDIVFTLAATGHIDTSMSAAKMVIVADGVHSITFGENFSFLYGIVSGQILTAGTYQFFLLYDPSYGTVTVNVPGATAEGSIATQLIAPANFMAAADGENDIDLTWDDVANESSYLIEYSLTGTSGWTTLATPAAGSTSSSQSGLSAGDTRYYRIKAVGDGVAYLDSPYSSTSATTENAGDVTAPTFTFSPTSGTSTWAVNEPIVITANEEIRNTDGSPIVSNQAGIVTLKLTNSGGSDIAKSWTLDSTKKIITITPTTLYGDTQLVYVAVNNVEDVSGNEVTVAISSTFTTTAYSLFNGVSNFLRFGDILDPLFAVNDTNFWIGLTIKNYNSLGTQVMVSKYSVSGTQITFYVTLQGSDLLFGVFGSASWQRRVRWTGVLNSSEQVILVKYDGSIDTSNGLDRFELLINTVDQGSGALDINTGTLAGTLRNSTAQLAAGTIVNSAGVPDGSFFSGQAKDLIIRSLGGATLELNVPVLRSGTDTSGNSRNGTWV